jgi:tetratricopeptide (TPR) repeat protein
MLPSSRPIILPALAAALLMLPACQRDNAPVVVGAPGGARTNLKHFEGVMNNARVTFDHARSDLCVRAARALEAGDAAAAEALYREEVAKYPDDHESYEDLAACLSFQRRYDEARAEYERALHIKPGSVDGLYGMGCVAYKQGRHAESAEYLQKALAIAADDPRCHRVLGFVYEELGDQTKAAHHFGRAAELDPKFAVELRAAGKLGEVKD